MDTGIAGLGRLSACAPQRASVLERDALQVEDVVLHHLRSPADIKSIVPLREEIDLSVHAAAGAQHFERLEKKETSAVSSTASSSGASGSARSASSRWATN